ncbi:MAG: Asp-tRNA(Asn)/Glu-tRNA(Gln) amidotransferase subunit GatA [Dehalococcoidia bacterium]|nr:Asp-tRNA(Asn)/Glu-tRNA(Gln) amidotransferase subunit GatA [Dehalococcoidia bacterium]
MPELYDLTIHEAQALLQQRKASSTELTQAVLARIRQVEPRVQAFVTVTEEQALADARVADERIARGDAAPLTGIPMQIKDNMNTTGIRTTCSSRMLEDYVPIYDATVVAKLRAQGAVLVGKGNMDEFAMGSSTENSAFHPTRNPWDLGRVPGGSSGGGAAAVAASECFYSLGSDTGGSIRQPAALCGVTGIKPTYGRVSRYGLVAFASSLDQIGPLCKDAEDCAIVLSAIAGHDPYDSTSTPSPVPDYCAALSGGVRGLRIGVPKEYFGEGFEPGVERAVRDAIREFGRLGATVEECSLPLTRYGLPVYYIIAPSECSANLARYDGVKYGHSYKGEMNMWEAMERTRRDGFGPEVRRRIMLGAYALSAGYYDAYYRKAMQVRTLIRREFEDAFQRYDVLVTPTTPSVAFKLGERTADPVAMYKSDICTIPVNIAGIPCISVPCGFDAGMPVGMQVMAKPLAEETIFRVAHAYQQATDWHIRRPRL